MTNPFDNYQIIMLCLSLISLIVSFIVSSKIGYRLGKKPWVIVGNATSAIFDHVLSAGVLLACLLALIWGFKAFLGALVITTCVTIGLIAGVPNGVSKLKKQEHNH